MYGGRRPIHEETPREETPRACADEEGAEEVRQWRAVVGAMLAERQLQRLFVTAKCRRRDGHSGKGRALRTARHTQEER